MGAAQARAADCSALTGCEPPGLGYFFAFLLVFLGTFFPARRASDKPMAMACLRLLTVFPDRPLFKVPRLRSCMARSTLRDAALLYFRAIAYSSLSMPVG
jgi:hypothetical protein